MAGIFEARHAPLLFFFSNLFILFRASSHLSNKGKRMSTGITEALLANRFHSALFFAVWRCLAEAFAFGLWSLFNLAAFAAGAAFLALSRAFGDSLPVESMAFLAFSQAFGNKALEVLACASPLPGAGELTEALAALPKPGI